MDDGGWAVFLFLGAFIFFIVMFFVQQNQISDYREALSEANGAIITANGNIDSANDNISDANEAINEAKANAWSDYDSMGDDIENLQTVDSIQTVDTVPDPHPKKDDN